MATRAARHLPNPSTSTEGTDSEVAPAPCPDCPTENQDEKIKLQQDLTAKEKEISKLKDAAKEQERALDKKEDALKVANDEAAAAKAAQKKEAIDKVRGAVMICYPMGLPDWDVVRQCLEGNEELAGTSYANDEFDPESSQLWFAGKMMIPENKLSDHVGRHEKTKVVVKVTKKGSGAPQREQAIDQTTQKEMMAFYHRKQEEMKKLADNQDDDYTASTWANPKSLKGHFAGVSDVRFR